MEHQSEPLDSVLSALGLRRSVGTAGRSTGTAAVQLPSVKLGKFLDAHLDKMLPWFDPAGKPLADIPVDEVSQMRTSFAESLATAPPNTKPAYQGALVVCSALTQLISERDQTLKRYLGNQQQETRIGTISVAPRPQAYLNGLAQARWDQRANELKQSILTLYARERELELPAGSHKP